MTYTDTTCNGTIPYTAFHTMDEMVTIARQNWLDQEAAEVRAGILAQYAALYNDPETAQVAAIDWTRKQYAATRAYHWLTERENKADQYYR